jgi:hypothetical protein
MAALACSAAARVAYAETPIPTTPDRAELALDIEAGVAGLSPADVRSAIERELELPTVDATPSSSAVLSVRSLGERRVAVSFRQANGRHVDREIDLPEERERALETLGLLSVNLVRNEAAELVAAMLERQRAPEPAPPPAPAVTPPVIAPPPPPVQPAVVEPPPCKRREGYQFVDWGADVAPYVGTSRWEPPHSVRRLSLEFAGGYSEGVHGVGVSPLVHMTSKFVCGAELAGIGNAVGGPVEGAQLGGIFNYAKDVKGAQFSGVVNISRDLSGVQGSLVNVANGTVHGVQIGLVNVADDSDFSLGLVNVMKKGRFGVDGFGAETGFFSLALKNGGSHWHSFYGISYRARADANLRYGLLLGLGAHITTNSRRFYVDIDGLAMALGNDRGDFPDQTSGGWLSEIRAVLGYRPFRHLSIYAGPSYNAYYTENVGSELPVRSKFVSTVESSTFAYSQWPGFTLGVQLMTGD